SEARKDTGSANGESRKGRSHSQRLAAFASFVSDAQCATLQHQRAAGFNEETVELQAHLRAKRYLGPRAELEPHSGLLSRADQVPDKNHGGYREPAALARHVHIAFAANALDRTRRRRSRVARIPEHSGRRRAKERTSSDAHRPPSLITLLPASPESNTPSVDLPNIPA